MINTTLPYIILGVVATYFIALTFISHLVSKKESDNETFFIANRKAPWYLVTIGLIGASISGVTFVSVPGAVGTNGLNQAFAYMQLVMGYVAGYVVIALVLMPVYYKMNLVSIYGYLEERFGHKAYKTGAALFMISRTIGSAFRMYLMILILQRFALDPLGVPIAVTAFVCIGLVWFYTYKGGTQTILYTDVLLTFCFLSALVLTIFAISDAMKISVPNLTAMAWNSDLSRIFYFTGGWNDPNNFFKQFIGGALITITMTGLDQDLMQKNLACKNIKEAQLNMFTFSAILVFVNLLFLFLGAFLYLYAASAGHEIPAKSDLMYPTMAFKHLSTFSAVIFVIGIVGSTFSSSDSALTALTTSFCVDFLDFNKKAGQINPSLYEYDDAKIAIAKQELAKDQTKLRFKVHVGIALTLFFVVMLFAFINNEAIINELFKAAGYTYGPLLGLFSFGFMTTRVLKTAMLPIKFLNDNVVPIICVISPILCYILDKNAATLLGGFKLGFLLLLLNGILTFAGLWLVSKASEVE